jgi:hypothetical protein
MVVGGDSRERAIELARRMEDSRRFTQTYINTEHTANAGSGDTVQLDIDGIYVPDTTPTQASAPAPAAPKADKPKRGKP